MHQPVILLYAADSAIAARLQSLCAIRKFRLRRVGDADLNSAVGELALGRSIPVPPPGQPLPEPVLVFCGLSNAQLDWMLVELRKGKIFCMKAILTPANAQWTFLTLYQELSREREAMGG